MALDRQSKQFLRTFGHRIRSLREAKGWTLEDTEEHGWNAWTHLQQIETGKKNINLTTVQKITKLYKISLSELFEGL